MQPLRIRAYLLDGRIAGTEPYFPLDSILAAEWIRRNYPGSFYQSPPPGMKENWIEAPLPFERRGRGNKWYWACSFNMTPPATEYITHWHRRFDDHLEQYLDFQGRRGKVSGQSGQFKAYRMPLNIFLFPGALEWYAVGRLKEVQELCQDIAALGKKPAQGFGIIERWEVIPWPEDWSEAWNGKVTRAIPVSTGLPAGVEHAGMRLYGIRPPYWRRENQMACFMPEVRVPDDSQT